MQCPKKEQGRGVRTWLVYSLRGLLYTRAMIVIFPHPDKAALHAMYEMGSLSWAS